MKRKRDRDEWLWDRIDEDLIAMADEREKLLMESEELQDVKVPEGMLENIHRELEMRNGTARKFRIRRRMVIAVAAAAVSCVGFGVIGYGNREYEPEIIEREVGDDTTIKVNNSDAIASGSDEEEVCQEIQEKLGVLPVRPMRRRTHLCRWTIFCPNMRLTCGRPFLAVPGMRPR